MEALFAAAAAIGPCDALKAAADSFPAGPWHGVYVLDESASDDLEEVIEQATKQVRRRARGRVQSALKQRLDRAECLSVSSDSAAVTIESEEGPVWVVSRAGTAQRAGGRAAGRALPATITDGEITIAAEGERGDGRWRLRRTADGSRLTVEVYMKPERLDQPVSYRLVYVEVP